MRRQRERFHLSYPIAALMSAILLLLAACGNVDTASPTSPPTEAEQAPPTATAAPLATETEPTAAPATATPPPTDTETAASTEPATPTAEPTAAPTVLPPLEPVIGLETVAAGMTAPLALAAPQDGSNRLFVADQIGLIWVLTAEGERLSSPYLDLRDRMVQLNAGYDERGLLGLTLHPNYAENGRLYVYYSAPLRDGGPSGWNHTSHVSAFTVSADNPDQADPESEQLILQVDQPQSNHNGGHIAFGPDNTLYIALGDGGGANDVGTGHADGIGNGQDVTTLLGSILRIDVDGGDPYAIPDDNPFVGAEGLDEIFAYGLRNPFRMSFDRGGDRQLFVGDVGQNLWEEVNIVTRGGNYGWPIMEGTHCFSAQTPNAPPDTCPDTGSEGEALLLPILEYPNSNLAEGLGRSVIGGHIYRGSAMPAFQGRYIFGDWSESFNQPRGTLFVATPPEETGAPWPFESLEVTGRQDGRLGEFLLAFGEDTAGELYLLTSERSGPSGETGTLYRMTAPD